MSKRLTTRIIKYPDGTHYHEISISKKGADRLCDFGGFPKEAKEAVVVDNEGFVQMEIGCFLYHALNIELHNNPELPSFEAALLSIIESYSEMTEKVKAIKEMSKIKYLN